REPPAAFQEPLYRRFAAIGIGYFGAGTREPFEDQPAPAHVFPEGLMALTKQRKQLLMLAALLVVAALVWYANFDRAKGAPGGATFRADSYTPINAQDFSIIFKQRGDAQRTEYKPSG